MAVFDDTGTLEIPGLLTRAVLAVLLLRADSVVSVDSLVEALWGEHPPASATSALYNHVNRLRRQLGDEGGERIRTVAPGYSIRVEPGELDLHVFAELRAGGRAAVRDGQWSKASADLTAALALWRGAPVSDVPDLNRKDPRIQQLQEARLQALEDRIEADLQLGRHREVIGDLRALVDEHPLLEAFHGQLMLALYRSDRQGEALAAYREMRTVLDEELGVEPSASIRRLHRAILNADPELAAPAPAPVTTPLAPTPVPVVILSVDGPTANADSARASTGGSRFQLPADTRVFTGRTRELDQLVDLAGQAPQGTEAGMVVISAIDGLAGIGKSALVVRAAHRLREKFPDGQLFLDLHGHTTGLDPLTAGDALDWLLRSLGTPPQLMPRDLGERAATYRDRLSGTRTLIVLDNAATTAQVRPLLPGTPGCLVLVTSRKRLTGLDDAHSVALDVLPEADAIALLHKVAGPGRIPAHHPAIPEVIALCGYLPLAIRVIAARLRHRRTLRLEDVVGQLRDETARLGHLQDEDRSLTAVFESSYTALPTAERQMFRRLGLIPGPDVDAHAAANLVDTDLDTAERLLESLLDHNLLTEHLPHRYRFHDLVRLYARIVGENEPAEDRDAAFKRLMGYYQYAAQAANRFLARHTRPGPSPAIAVPRAAALPPDRSAALAWMHTERENLLATVAFTQPICVIALAASLSAFLHHEGPWPQAAALHKAALAAAQECGDRRAEANALWDLGRARQLTGDVSAAADLHEQALAIYRSLNNRLGESNTLFELGRVRKAFSDNLGAVDLLKQALDTYQELGDRQGEANTLEYLGSICVTTGNYSAAADLQERALVIYQGLGDRLGEANTLFQLGRVRSSTGDPSTATDLHQRARTTYQELGNRQGEANALLELGSLQHLIGDYAAAIGLHERALAIFQGLGHCHNEAYALWDLGRARYMAGDHSAAIDLYEQALMIFRSLGNLHGEACILSDFGRARQAAGDHAAATSLQEQSLTMLRSLGDRQGETEVLNCTGALVAVTTGPEEALAIYRQALNLAREVNSPLDEAHALEGSARCSEDLGDRKAALTDLREAVAIYSRIRAAETPAATAYLASLEKEGRRDETGAANGLER